MPIYKERGGGWIGDGLILWQGTWPFSSIAIYGDRVVLKVGWKTAELKMSDIVEVKRKFFFPFIADGIELIHQNETVPRKLVFWSLGREEWGSRMGIRPIKRQNVWSN